MKFEDTWDNIISHAGEEFFTKTKISFVYKIVNDCIIPDRTNYPLSKANFEKAVQLDSLEGPGQISDLVRGPSYVFAIITDKRIRQNHQTLQKSVEEPLDYTDTTEPLLTVKKSPVTDCFPDRRLFEDGFSKIG